MSTKPGNRVNGESDGNGEPVPELAHLMPYASETGPAGRLVAAIGFALLAVGLAVLVADYTSNSHVSVYTPVSELVFDDPVLRECVITQAADEGWQLSGDVRSLRCNNPSARGVTSLAGVVNLVNLTEINVAHNNLVDIGALSRLSRLEFLDLGYNKLSAAALGALPPTLRSLSVDHNRLDTLEWVRELRDLDSLSAGHNLIRSMNPLASLTKLRVLNLENNEVDDISPLKELHRLEVLVLEKNRVRDISALTALGNLLVVDLGTNRITDVGPLASLQHLFELDLSHNPVARIEALRDSIDLGRLSLSGTDVENVAALESLGRLESVDLTGTRLPCADYLRLVDALASTMIRHDHECSGADEPDERHPT